MSDQSQVDLVVTGMTCSSCAARIERKLNKLDGVDAAVNYATGVAHVKFTGALQIPDLVATVEAAGYHALPPSPLLDEQVAALEAEHERDLFRRWVIGALFAIPTTLISMVHGFQFSNWQWFTVLLATPVVTWSAWPLHTASFKNAKYRTTTMDTLVSVGIFAAYFGSIAILLKSNSAELPHVYIDVATIVPVFVLFGRWLEARNKRAAGAALRALVDASAKTALVWRDSNFVEVAISDVIVGDRVLVRAESTIPVDGKVLSGVSSVSNALLTGESLPTRVDVHENVRAGALNHEGELEVEVTAVGNASTIARLAALVAAAQSGKANIARIADRISGVFVPVVFGITLLTAIAWWFIDSGRVLEVVIAVLVIACPCALGLATPTALVVGSGRAARMGVLVAGPQVFEQSQSIDVVVFDKTGTLTAGQMQVLDLQVNEQWHPVLKALADASSHPISQAVASHLKDVHPAELKQMTAVAGSGVRAELNGNQVAFGSAKLAEVVTGASVSATTSYFIVNGEVMGSVSVEDVIDAGAKATVQRLQTMGLKVVMASGDVKAVAEKVATSLGISEFYAEQTPAQKIEIIKSLQADGKKVAMVGDGSNDAPALAQADIGIAMGRGTEIAQATADITLLRADLSLIPSSLGLARQTLRTIKQNLGWAFGYNLAAIPLAMTGNLNPVIAGIAMSASSVLVVTNSLRLRNHKID